MAISGLTVVENNIIENVDLLSIHNPLVFIVRATYSGTPPDYIYASIVGLDDVDYKCIYLRDESATERDFYFVADEILRAYLGGIADFDQSDDTILAVPNLAQEVTITFTDDGNEGEPYEDTQTIVIVNAARDFENVNGACMIDRYNNESLTYIGAVGNQLYAYWYNDDATNIINGNEGIEIGADTDEQVINIRDNITSDPNYNTWIREGANLADIWCYYYLTPPSSIIVFEAQNGSAITFSDISLPAGFGDLVTNNGTSGARLLITVSSLPIAGNWFRFKFVSDLTAMPPIGYVNVDKDFGITGGSTFDKGFIRKAISPTTETDISITINGVYFKHDLIVREWCSGDVMLKYLDRNGQYRFMPFTKYYSRNSNPESIGSINELITSIANGQSDTRNIGYKNNDTLRLTAYSLGETELALMRDLFTSKDVQIYLDKWLRVTIDGDNISKQEKRKFKDITITVNLPQSYNVTEL